MPYVFNPFTGRLDFTNLTTPGGTFGQIQFNNGALFAASSNLNWDDDFQTLQVGATSISNSDLKIQINAPVGGEANYSVHKNGSNGFWLGMKNGTGFNSITSPGYVRMVTTDPFAIVMNNSFPATVWNYSGDVAIGGNITTTAGANATMVVLASSRVGIGITGPQGSLHITPNATTTVGAIVQAASTTQTANLSQWRDSAGVVQLAVAANGRDFVLDTTTGSKVGTSTSQKLAFWGATPIIRPATGGAAATFVANTSGIANDTATFDGYTIGQVVKALRNTGLLN